MLNRFRGWRWCVLPRVLLALLLALGLIIPAGAAGWFPLVVRPAAVGYTGPGDVQALSGTSAFWGLRALSSATRGNKIANVCTLVTAVDTCVDMSSDATTGNMVITTIPGASACNNSTQICNVKILYDQSGLNGCNSNSAPCNLTQATVATRPTIVISCLGSLPCMDFNGSQHLDNGTPFGNVQPFTFSAVAERTGAFTSFGDIFGSGTAGQIQFLYNSSANSVGQYAGTLTFVTASDSAFHAIQNVFATTASSVIRIDSTETTGLSQSGNSFGTQLVMGGDNNLCTCRIAELMEYNATMSSGNRSTMNSNQHTYWGF